MSFKLSLIALAFSSLIFTDIDIVHDIVGPHQASADESNQKPANTVNSSEVSEQISLEESSEQPANSDQATSISFVSPNLIVDEVKDSDILGVWDCTSYKDETIYEEWSHQKENGGNGRVGSGYFFSNTGTLTLWESDQESSLNSPKRWSINRDDVISDEGSTEGEYSLLLSKITFYTSQYGSNQVLNIHHVQFIEQNKFVLEPSYGPYGAENLPNPNVVCERVY